MNLTNFNEIQKILDRNDFRFSKSFGQNFLIKEWVPNRIVEESKIDEDSIVVEVGPGIGCLTRELSKNAKLVHTIELDNSLKPILNETLSDCNNVDVIFGDALKMNLDFGKAKFVANIPYNITSPLLTKIVKTNSFDVITVMVQKEVAKRICASSGESDYSAFGIFVQWYCEAKILFDVDKGCFHPQPKVDSCVIQLIRREVPPASVKDVDLLFNIIRSSFNMRRKTLCNALVSNIGWIDKQKCEKVLDLCGFDLKVRGEALSIGDFAKICDELYALKPCDL